MVSGGAFPLTSSAATTLAPLSARWIAYVIDNMIVLTTVVTGLAIAHALGVPGQRGGELVWFNLLYATWFFANILFIGYTSILHAIAGQTIGKRIVGIGVVRSDGSPLGWGRSSLRTFGYFVSSIFYLGFLLAFVDKERRTLHDYMADTVVVEFT